MRWSVAWIGIMVGCGAPAGSDADDTDTGLVTLEVPRRSPVFDSGQVDLVLATPYGFVSSGTVSYDTTFERTGGSDPVEEGPFPEERTYAAVSGSPGGVSVDGIRFKDNLVATYRLTDDGWLARNDPRDGSWRRLLPAEPSEGETFEGLMTWADLDPSPTTDLPDGRTTIISLDASAPEGTDGTVHVRATFEAKGFSGQLDQYFAEGKGAVYERRQIIDPDGVEEVDETRQR